MNKNSYNKVILIGHLGADPEGRYTKSGRSTVTFSLATNEVWKTAEGATKEHTDYLYKGQLISIEGSLRSRKWESKLGEQRKTVEVVCSNITPLEWKK